MSKITNKVADAGHAVAHAAKTVGHTGAKGAENAAEFVKEKTGIGEGEDVGVAGIKEHMDVIASCGKKVGVVDRVEASAIKLTKKDSPDDQHHYVPLGWVGRVDSHVHLTTNSQETEANWKPDTMSCGCSS